MSIVDGWLDWATREPGPANKQYPTPNRGIGIAWHSMEGWYPGSLAELMKPDRQASWTFSLLRDGALMQHYPVTASCWASGNAGANTRYWSVELEGIQSMPIDDGQLRTALRIISEWEAHTGLVATREGEPDDGRTMVQHREVATLWSPNAGPTACPSERYARLWEALASRAQEGENVTLEERLGRLERLVAGNGYRFDGHLLTGEEALVAADADGGSLFLGLGNTQAQVTDHIATHPTGAGLPPGTTFTAEVK